MGLHILAVEALTKGLSRRYGGSKVSRETTRLGPRAGRPDRYTRATARWSPSRRRAGQGTQISYASLLLAVLIGILHAAVAPVLVIGDVHPNLILVAVVLATVLNGFLPGVAWAFVGGLTANLLIRQHGDNAEVVAAQRADTLLDRGDREGQRVWLRIRRAIASLHATPTGPAH